MKFGIVIAGVLFILAAAMPAPLRAGDPPASAPTSQSTAAEQIVHDYCDMLHAGQGVAAIDKYWNFDAMFDGIFGDAMKTMTDAQRVEMRKLMLALISKAYTNPAINDALAKATFGNFASHELPDNRVAVDFNIILESGKLIPNTLVFGQNGEQWQIVDATANNTPMTATIGSAYRAGDKSVTPLQFVQLIASGN